MDLTELEIPPNELCATAGCGDPATEVDLYLHDFAGSTVGVYAFRCESHVGDTQMEVLLDQAECEERAARFEAEAGSPITVSRAMVGRSASDEEIPGLQTELVECFGCGKRARIPAGMRQPGQVGLCGSCQRTLLDA